MIPEIPIDRFEVFAGGLDHPECCAFDKQGNLWAGGEAGQIYMINQAGIVKEILCMGGFSAGLAFSPQDELYVCNSALGIVRIDDSARVTLFADEVAGKRIREANFPVFDKLGNLYVTDSGEWRGRSGRLIRFNPAGPGVELLAGLGYANGLALTEDERTLFLVESDTDTVYRIRLDEERSIVSAPEIYIKPIGHLPDGLSLDLEGNLYITSYGSHEIFRVALNKDATLLAHDPNGVMLGSPTNLVFGGPNLEHIYVANLGRWAITRAYVGRRGLLPVNLRS